MTCVTDGVHSRVHIHPRPDWLIGEVSSVINGHLSRMSTLSCELAFIPSAWNGHIAPLVLRTMIDCLISLRWILVEPRARSREFIGYGLGQAKLLVAHLEEKLSSQPDDELIKSMIERNMDWILTQKLVPFVEVNLGSWSGASVRQMAKDTGDEDLYNLSFSPFSACVHNTWEHMYRYDTEACGNPLHKYHRIPFPLDQGINPDYLFRAAKYLTLAFENFDKATNYNTDLQSPRDYFDAQIGKVVSDVDEPFNDATADAVDLM